MKFHVHTVLFYPCPPYSPQALSPTSERDPRRLQDRGRWCSRFPDALASCMQYFRSVIMHHAGQELPRSCRVPFASVLILAAIASIRPVERHVDEILVHHSQTRGIYKLSGNKTAQGWVELHQTNHLSRKDAALRSRIKDERQGRGCSNQIIGRVLLSTEFVTSILQQAL